MKGINVKEEDSSDGPTPLGEKQPMPMDSDVDTNPNDERSQFSTSPQLVKGPSGSSSLNSGNVSRWRRIGLILVVLALLWMASRVRAPSKPKVVHSSR